MSNYKLRQHDKIFNPSRVTWVGIKYEKEATWKTVVCYTGLQKGNQCPASLFSVDNGNKTHWTFNKEQAIKDAEIKFNEIVKSL